MLRIANLYSRIGKGEILKGISMHVKKNEIVTLIGANGAGKSTLINTIAGLIPAWEGEIWFGEEEIGRLSPMKIVRKGIALVPEGRQLFAPLSVLDNLQLGAYPWLRRSTQGVYAEMLEMVMELFPILGKRTGQLAGTLSGGEQQMLAIARALMSKPKMILLDEPSMGLAPRVVEEIFGVIDRLRKKNLTVLLVEQNARLALELADRGYVVETGQIIMEGSSEDLRQNKEIERAYLGKAYKEIWE
ncbi:MAG: ABC transporter ATP-binding protein [bacterium]|jgi:branched-chain amino acid transport system ATP-binding protein|nr:ABC transporter ATP-binding protein [bacterium]